VWAGVWAGDAEVGLEERKLVLVDMNFVVLAGRGRRVLRAISAAEKLTLRVQRSTLVLVQYSTNIQIRNTHNCRVRTSSRNVIAPPQNTTCSAITEKTGNMLCF